MFSALSVQILFSSWHKELLQLPDAPSTCGSLRLQLPSCACCFQYFQSLFCSLKFFLYTLLFPHSFFPFRTDNVLIIFFFLRNQMTHPSAGSKFQADYRFLRNRGHCHPHSAPFQLILRNFHRCGFSSDFRFSQILLTAIRYRQAEDNFSVLKDVLAHGSLP